MNKPLIAAVAGLGAGISGCAAAEYIKTAAEHEGGMTTTDKVVGGGLGLLTVGLATVSIIEVDKAKKEADKLQNERNLALGTLEKAVQRGLSQAPAPTPAKE